MIRKSFLMHVNPDAHAEYEKRHSPIWEELAAVLKGKAGWPEIRRLMEELRRHPGNQQVRARVAEVYPFHDFPGRGNQNLSAFPHHHQDVVASGIPELAHGSDEFARLRLHRATDQFVPVELVFAQGFEVGRIDEHQRATQRFGALAIFDPGKAQAHFPAAATSSPLHRIARSRGVVAPIRQKNKARAEQVLGPVAKETDADLTRQRMRAHDAAQFDTLWVSHGKVPSSIPRSRGSAAGSARLESRKR